MLPTSLGRLRLLASHIPRSASPASLAPPLARRPMSTAPTFPRSPVPERNGEHVVRKAGCLIIGDEVLNGASAEETLSPRHPRHVPHPDRRETAARRGVDRR